MKSHGAIAACVLLALPLVGCNEPQPAQPVENEMENRPPLRSIIREDIDEQIPVDDEVEVPLELTVGFGDSGNELDADAIEAIDAFFGEERLQGEEPVTLFGHSDSIGSDEANEKASRARAQAVADYLEERGMDPERITIVALGEHNPVAPNYMLDGNPDPEGQQRNRRVVIAMGTPAQIIERRALERQEREVEAEAAEDASTAIAP